MTESADVVVIGLGPGGELVAGDLAAAGLGVLAVNADLVGGECPYWGCVPTKMMARAADVLAEARRVDQLAGHATVTADWAPVARRIRDEATDHWDDKVAVDRLVGKGARFVRGRARLTSPTSAVVATADGEVSVSARRALVVATGSQPAVPPIDGLSATPYWTNHEMVEADVLPASLAILGGGAIGCEFAQIAARFGVRVTVVEAAPRLLAIEEPESGELLAQVFEREGIDVRVGVGATSVRHDDRFDIGLEDGSTVRAERLLVATGRRIDLGALGADRLGVDAAARTLTTDGHCRVVTPDGALPTTFALGDVTGQGAFTHVSMHQAAVVRDVILGKDVPPGLGTVDRLPRVTFTDPEVGAVGLTAAQARQEWGDDVQVAQLPLDQAATRAWIHGPGNDGFLLVVAHDGVLVGATSAGPYGGEVLGALSVAVQARVPVADLLRQVWAYPTLHRGIQAVLEQLSRD
jgi:pyruvate/2-oxoglutarate dehydrogenase complex dihydrolipoamide dehydrogenase (E3) component